MASDTYETMGQLVRGSQPTDWIYNIVVRERETTPTKLGVNPNMPKPFPASQQGPQMPKIHHPDIREPSQVTWHKIHDNDRCQRSFPEHPSDFTIIPDDHNVFTMELPQVDKATVWHIVSV